VTAWTPTDDSPRRILLTDDLHAALAAIHPDPVAGPDAGGRGAAPDDGGNAQLPRHDGRVGELGGHGPVQLIRLDS
jgi:hypothetical protein